MRVYDAEENSRRLKEGILALVSGSAVVFPANKAAQFIVIFDGNPSLFSVGRITLFQQYFLSNFGKIPEIVKEMPSCIKVFFHLSVDNELEREQLIVIFRHSSFLDLCQRLDVNYVQFGVEVYFRRANFKA